eukprot:gene14377-27399_t
MAFPLFLAVLGGSFATPTPHTVQFQQNGRCLTATGFKERADLVVGSCAETANAAWVIGPDSIGNPQIASYGNEEQCINDLDVSCAEGNRLMLSVCQKPGKKSHVTVANHWKYDAGKQQIVSLFCNSSTTALCLTASSSTATTRTTGTMTRGNNNVGVSLGKCTNPGSNGWHMVPISPPPAPPRPSPAPPAPPLPPLPPVPPKGVCKDCPNIVFVLTDDQDQLIGGSLPAALGHTPLTKAKALLMDQGAYAENFFIHTPICCPS